MENNKKREINQDDMNEIARLITEGMTSGILDDENDCRISWELKTDIMGAITLNITIYAPIVSPSNKAHRTAQ